MELLRQVAGLFVEGAPDRLAALRDALARRDSEALREVAHSIKGSAASLMAARTFTAARKLEALAQRGDLRDAAPACATLEREVARLIQALSLL